MNPRELQDTDTGSLGSNCDTLIQAAQEVVIVVVIQIQAPCGVIEIQIQAPFGVIEILIQAPQEGTVIQIQDTSNSENLENQWELDQTLEEDSPDC